MQGARTPSADGGRGADRHGEDLVRQRYDVRALARAEVPDLPSHASVISTSYGKITAMAGL